MPPSPAGMVARPTTYWCFSINDLASPDPNVELAPAILFQTERVVSTMPTSASLRSAARASKPAPSPPAPSPCGRRLILRGSL